MIEGTAILSLSPSGTTRMSIGMIPSTVLVMPSESVTVNVYMVQGVKDTSRNGWYHNEAYRKAAEAHGLTVTKSAKYGWCETKLTEDLAKWAEDNFTKFDLQRRVLEKAKRKTVKSHSIKYTCPCCGNSVRATKAVNIRCADCDIMMEE